MVPSSAEGPQIHQDRHLINLCPACRRDLYEPEKVRFYCELEIAGETNKSRARESIRSLQMDDMDAHDFEDNDRFGAQGIGVESDLDISDSEGEAESAGEEDSDGSEKAPPPAPSRKRASGEMRSGRQEKKSRSHAEGPEQELPSEDLGASSSVLV